LLVAIISNPFGGGGAQSGWRKRCRTALLFLDQAEQEAGHCEDGEQHEQDLRDARGAGGDAAETEPPKPNSAAISAMTKKTTA
jgi:hypothetical protein